MYNFEIGDQVDANIGYEDEFWIQAIVVHVSENDITVREIGCDDEYTLHYDAIS